MTRPLLSSVLLVVFAASGCTQSYVVLALDTSMGVPCDMDEIRVEITGVDDATQVTLMDASELPATLTVLRGGQTQDAVVEVRGYRAGEEVAYAVAGIRFVDNHANLHRILLDETCRPDDPCDRSEAEWVRPFDGPPGPELRRECVERRPFVGYTTRRVETEDFVDACMIAGNPGITLLRSSDEAEAPLPAELFETFQTFDFTFYGQDPEGLWIGDNGYISFGETAPQATREAGVQPWELHRAGTPRPAVLAFWDDLITREQGVCVAFHGDAPHRRLWITWSDVCFGAACADGDSISVTVALEETSHRVLLLYGGLQAVEAGRAEGAFATIGLVGHERPACEDCGSDGLCLSGPSEGQACGYYPVLYRQAQEDGLNSLVFDPIWE